jgi:hypothetical protein
VEPQPWHRTSLRRHFLDFHIADWHPDFLGRFDPEEFALCVAAERATAATVFANSHTGLCTYPTAVGAQHGNLRGRDLLAETIGALHRHGLAAIVYYCTIFTDWYWDHHPEARTVDAQGRGLKRRVSGPFHPRRFSTLCPNNQGYREFVVAQLNEICDGYEFEGAWPDMTFWPAVCCCPSCRERFRREAGAELPTMVDWTDKRWVLFQRKRQEWLADFAQLVTSTIRRRKPGVTVAHQSHAFLGDWRLGASLPLAEASDWLSADLYGERYELSFSGKLFQDISPALPYEQINSWCWPDINEHVVTRTEDDLRLGALSTMINRGAMTFIDAVDPVGTIHTREYQKAGRVFEKLAAYEPEVGGVLSSDVGVYFSYESAIDLRENGLPLAALASNFEPGWKPLGENPHWLGAVNFCRSLLEGHVPYRVLTRKDLPDLAGCQVVVLPSAVMLSEEEVRAFREFVRGGGGLLATTTTSLLGTDGTRHPTFQLADLFGCDYAGQTTEALSYASPDGKASSLLDPFDEQSPVTIAGVQQLVRARPGATVRATITLPYTDPAEPRFASLLTDPPGPRTSWPSILTNRFGKGRVTYAAGAIEAWRHQSQREIHLRLVRELAAREFWFTAAAPQSVEVVGYLQEERRRFVVNLLNFQPALPNIPVHGIEVCVRMGGRKAVQVTKLPTGEKIGFRAEGDSVHFTADVLGDFDMYAVTYSEGGTA